MESLSKWLKKYFIPHDENNFKPHFLRHESMLLVFFVVIVVELAFFVQIFIVFDKTSFLASVLPGVLTTLTNKERVQINEAPLVENDLLTKAAELKAQDMATRGYFAHTSPDGKTPWYWLGQVGYNYSMAGENLAVNFFESDDVAQAWMNSPTHRANIVKDKYTEIGIGVASGVYEGRKTVFVAQFFGTPIIPTAPSTPTPPIKPKITAPSGIPPKAVTPPVKPPVITPQPTPVVTPPAIAIAPAVTPPTAVQVLGEETNSALATTENSTTPFNIELFIQKVLASPREYVSYVYGGIVLLITLALLLVLLIRSEIEHPLIVARGAALVAIILFLLFINTKILPTETKVPTEGLSASVIAY